MGILFEIIFTIIIDALFQFIIEFLIALGYESIVNSFKELKSANKYLALAGCAIAGTIIGLISYFIYPKRIFNNSSFYGLSLLISPIIVGFIMKIWGERRIHSNKRISVLSTFWGGAVFALAYSIIRFLLIR